MNGFQIFGLLVGVGASALVLVATLRRRIGRGAGLGWFLLWAAACITIAEPEITAVAARRLGITRGADLVFYCGILGAILGFFVVLARLRRIEEDLTTLTRTLALLEESPDRDRPGAAPDTGADGRA